MEKKVRGVEHEFAVNTQPTLPNRSLVHLVGMAIEELRKAGFVSSIMVEKPRLDFMAFNGFRVYDDMSHLELSTPCYNSPIEAVIYDKVAEVFTYYAVEGLRSYFKGINGYKNNVSNLKEGNTWTGNSYSTHGSILMDRKVCGLDHWDKMEKSLVPFMVARIPVIGGGDYVPCKSNGALPRAGKIMKGDNIAYTISPRAAYVKRVSSNDTVDARGILNQRNDPHATPEKYWRLHDINWEGLRSPFQVYIRDCLETLVMTAYEKGYYDNPPKIEDPVNAMKIITLDTDSMNWNISLEDGSKVDIISDIMQGFYLAGIENMLDEEATSNDMMCLKLIDATLKVLEKRSTEYFIDGLDWVTKKALIEEYAEDSDIEGQGLCNQFTLLDETVLRYLYEGESKEDLTTFNLEYALEFVKDAVPWEDWGNFKAMVRKALMNGPEGTREYIRCLVALEFPGLVKSIEWERINFYNATINLEEPFMFNRWMCGDILESASETFNTFTHALAEISEKSQIVYAPIDDYEEEV